MNKLAGIFDLGSVSNPAIGATPTGGAGYVLGIENIVSVIIGTFTVVAGVALLIYFAYGSITYVTAGGDEKRAGEARKVLTNAVIGLVIMVATMTIVSVILNIFGLSLDALPWLN